jgi:hypothetical protein
MKMQKLAVFVFSSFCLTFFSSVFAQGSTGEAEKKWFEKVDVSGFVDVYYQYISNNKQGAMVDSSRTLETYNKQFAVNAVELVFEKAPDKDDPWGFKLDFMNGQNAMYQETPFNTSNQSFNMNLLQEAYVSLYFNFLKGVKIDVGKMATHIGYEVLETKDNPNYTTGYIFFNTVPFIHTGARATATLDDHWSVGFYLYNSAQGTGFNSAFQRGGDHSYSDGPNNARALGTQVKGVFADKYTLVWNTVYGMDQVTARRSNMDNFVDQTSPQYTKPNQPGRFASDYWFVNNVILDLVINKQLSLDLDWTHGIKAGSTAPNTNTGATANTLNGNVSTVLPDGTDLATKGAILGREGRNIKKVYNTYGIWAKYRVNDKFLVALRYEYLDDGRYGGALGTNGYTPVFRYDLQYKKSVLGIPSGDFGTQLRSFTVTPTYNWTDNLLIKLDLRRDWALGNQFTDLSGRPASYQNGMALGMVAKF